MKALTLLQPWASLVACGAKQWETRSWRTEYRGIVAIHSSKRYSKALKEIAATEPFAMSLRHADEYPQHKLGKIIALARLVECVDTQLVAPLLDEKEIAFGDYSANRWAWRLADLRPIRQAVLCNGHLGIWQVPDDVERAIMKGFEL